MNGHREFTPEASDAIVATTLSPGSYPGDSVVVIGAPVRPNSNLAKFLASMVLTINIQLF